MTSNRTVLLVLLALSAFVVGCGGSGGGEGTTGSPASSASVRTRPATTPRGESRSHRPSQAEPKGNAASPHSGDRAHRGSATGAAAFETKGGDNSVQESGSEAGASEVGRAAIALHGYLDARAAGEWAKACSYLAANVTAQLAQFSPGASAGEKAPSCAKLLAGLSAGIPAAALRESTRASVGALRVDGDHAFLLFHGARGTDYFMPMAHENGEWKVAAIAPSALS